MKHVFAFYKENISELVTRNEPSFNEPQFNEPQFKELSFKDSELWTRLIKIVRIKAGDTFILFDENINVTAMCLEKTLTEKREIFAKVISLSKNISIEPKITFYLPLLKKETFEYATYVSAQMGIHKIVPIITEKSERDLYGKNEFLRIKKIMLSACEQSKNFVLPIITDAQPIKASLGKSSLTNSSLNKIYFDTDGKPIALLEKNNEPKEVIIGPEGGFSSDEEKLIRSVGFESYRLTKTVLRSKEAIVLGLGILASN